MIRVRTRSDAGGRPHLGPGRPPHRCSARRAPHPVLPAPPTARKPFVSTTAAPPSQPATAAEQFALRRQSPAQRIQHTLHGQPALSPLLVLIVAVVVFTLVNDRFIQPQALSILLQQTAIIAAL